MAAILSWPQCVNPSPPGVACMNYWTDPSQCIRHLSLNAPFCNRNMHTCAHCMQQPCYWPISPVQNILTLAQEGLTLEVVFFFLFPSAILHKVISSVNTNSWKKNISTVIVSTVPVDGLALSYARTHAGTVMTKFRPLDCSIWNL